VGLTPDIVRDLGHVFELDEARRHIEERFEKDRSLSWRKALDKRLEEVQEKHTDAFKDAVREAIEDADSALERLYSQSAWK
jgi:hypothetical protein